MGMIMGMICVPAGLDLRKVIAALKLIAMAKFWRPQRHDARAGE